MRGEPAPPPSAAVLRTMLAAALAENAPRKVVILTSDHVAPRGVLADATSRGSSVITRPVDPWAAIARAERVYAAGGETGFLALLAGRAVRCFDDSFYSGWGVTADDARVSQRPFRRTVDEIFAGACLVATRYLDPYRQNRVDVRADTVDPCRMAKNREHQSAGRRPGRHVVLEAPPRSPSSFRSSVGTPVFRRTTKRALSAAGAGSGGAVAVWASRIPAGLVEAAARQRIALIRVEDGFVRSVGLGSDFVPAASLGARHKRHVL